MRRNKRGGTNEMIKLTLEIDNITVTIENETLNCETSLDDLVETIIKPAIHCIGYMGYGDITVVGKYGG